jgi:hypothetical protein
VPVVILELVDSAISFIMQDAFDKSIVLLRKALTMLDQIDADSNPNDQITHLMIRHNMAVAYQRLGLLNECATSMEQCL